MSHAQAATLPRFQDPDAFDRWATGQPGRWELHDGVPVSMVPKRAVHAQLKLQCCLALRDALRARSLRCQAFVDGLQVPGPGARRFQPDVLVACGERVRPDAVLVEHPVILAEVLSPSTQATDMSLKLESYFALPSVQHYLVLSSEARRVIHFSRLDAGRLLTALHVAGAVELTHPGIAVTVEEVYADVDLVDSPDA